MQDEIEDLGPIAADAARNKAKRRADTIRAALDHLGAAAAPPAVGVTLIMPDGETLYLSADDARPTAETGPARGRA